MNKYVRTLQPDYSNYQIDTMDNKIIFSVIGISMMTNDDSMKFLISLRINFENINTFSKLEDIVCIDYVKFKVYSDN
jgi:hypothetical protein